jgi:hypothetical protein
MVVKEIGFYNNDTNSADSTTPILMQTSVISALALLNFYIGNNRVIKDLPLFSGSDIMGINNISTSTSSVSNLTSSRFLGIRLSTNIVIPPQIQFYATLLLPFGGGTGAAQGFANLRMYVKGYGKLFNPRNNY